MNTSTRAHYATADACHASTARGPLLRPYGVVIPASTANPIHAARLAHWQENPDAHRETLAACYREAMANPDARVPVTPELLTSARAWLRDTYDQVVANGYWPSFFPCPIPLAKALEAFSRPAVAVGKPCHLVPITSLNNGPHPVWSPIENLMFRFTHDWHHYHLSAAATFEGELAIARHILTPQVRQDDPLARLLASETIGQAAAALTANDYPPQIIATGILDLI